MFPVFKCYIVELLALLLIGFFTYSWTVICSLGSVCSFFHFVISHRISWGNNSIHSVMKLLNKKMFLINNFCVYFRLLQLFVCVHYELWPIDRLFLNNRASGYGDEFRWCEFSQLDSQLFRELLVIGTWIARTFLLFLVWKQPSHWTNTGPGNFIPFKLLLRVNF